MRDAARNQGAPVVSRMTAVYTHTRG